MSRYLLYGLGLSNKAIKEYFDINNIEYDIYIDGRCDLISDINLLNYDYIIKSPGISNDTNLIKLAKLLNINIITDIELYYLLFKDKYKIISISGSNGKTTTTSIIGSILNEYNVCGNIGIPIFSILNDINKGLIIECSSYMLEYTKTFKPNIYVLLNILPHHLDHHKTYEEYIDSKIKIINNMNHDDIVIYNLDDLVLGEKIKSFNVTVLSFSKTNTNADIYLKDGVIVYNNNKLLSVNDLSLKDEQFLDDILASILVGKILKLEDEWIINKVLTFRGLSHRFETVYSDELITIINDSKSTNPYSLVEGIKNLLCKYNGYNKILIMGGKIIDEDYSIVKEYINYFEMIFITGENKFILDNIFLSSKVIICDELEDIITILASKFEDKTVILFSPGAPSLDKYKSFEERGNHFKKLIERLIIEKYKK